MIYPRQLSFSSSEIISIRASIALICFSIVFHEIHVKAFNLICYFSDIDECTIPELAAKCVENAECCNLPAEYVCKCKPGFEGDGQVECRGEKICLSSQSFGQKAMMHLSAGDFAITGPNWAGWEMLSKGRIYRLICWGGCGKRWTHLTNREVVMWE